MNATVPAAPANLTALEWALLIVERDAYIVNREHALVTYHGRPALEDDVIVMFSDDAIEHEDEAAQLGATELDIARAYTLGAARGVTAGRAGDRSLPAKFVGI